MTDITLLTAVTKESIGQPQLQPKATGKVLTLQPDGKVNKTAVNSAVYHARQMSIDDLAGLSSLVEGMNGSQLILPASIPGMPEQFLMLSERYWTDRGLPANEDTLIPRDIWGFPSVQYLAKWFTPSPFMLIEFDHKDSMPNWLVPRSRAHWWEVLCRAVPGLAGAGRLLLPSSSSRVMMPWGWPYRPVAGIHGWVEVTEPADIQRATLALHQRLVLTGACYKHQSVNDGRTFEHLYTLIDPTVGRLAGKVYSGPPTVAGGLELIAGAPDYLAGGRLDTRTAIPPLSDEEQEVFCKRSGAIAGRIRRSGAPHIPGFAMSMDFPLELDDGTATSAREFRESGEKHWRLNAYWRGSESGAAYINRRENGSMFVYDCFGPTRHEIQEDPADVFAAGDATNINSVK